MSIPEERSPIIVEVDALRDGFTQMRMRRRVGGREGAGMGGVVFTAIRVAS